MHEFHIYLATTKNSTTISSEATQPLRDHAPLNANYAQRTRRWLVAHRAFTINGKNDVIHQLFIQLTAKVIGYQTDWIDYGILPLLQ